ncbi:hypothetical protein C0Q70_04193 [Pomacea canaliculata]|uniref:Uncharacterized protein n=1 Tax=Pomacea canaliculata TaxID=400727 RepID=A0A2T7PUV6_POMCA|nr:hypothetical protein C0Q70_04193 [Pomacea canaliculata]
MTPKNKHLFPGGSGACCTRQRLRLLCRAHVTSSETAHVCLTVPVLSKRAEQRRAALAFSDATPWQRPHPEDADWQGGYQALIDVCRLEAQPGPASR